MKAQDEIDCTKPYSTEYSGEDLASEIRLMKHNLILALDRIDSLEAEAHKHTRMGVEALK